MRNNRKRNLKKLVKNIITAATLPVMSLNSLPVSASEQTDEEQINKGLAGGVVATAALAAGISYYGIKQHEKRLVERTAKNDKLWHIREKITATAEYKEKCEKESGRNYASLLQITNRINDWRQIAGLKRDKEVYDVVLALKEHNTLTNAVINALDTHNLPVAQRQVLELLGNLLRERYSLEKRKKIVETMVRDFMKRNSSRNQIRNSIIRICRAEPYHNQIIFRPSAYIEEYKPIVSPNSFNLQTRAMIHAVPGRIMHDTGGYFKLTDGVATEESYLPTDLLFNKTVGNLLGDVITLHFSIEPPYDPAGGDGPGFKMVGLARAANRITWEEQMTQQQGHKSQDVATEGYINIQLSLTPPLRIEKNTRLGNRLPVTHIYLQNVGVLGGGELPENYLELRRDIMKWFYQDDANKLHERKSAEIDDYS